MSNFLSNAGFRLSHVWLVAKTYVRFSLRTGAGIVFLFMLFVGAIATAAVLGKMLVMMADAIADFGFGKNSTTAERLDGAKAVFTNMMFINAQVRAEFPDYLTNPPIFASSINPVEHPATYNQVIKHPALLSILYSIFLVLAPVSACLVGFSQTAVDIGNKGLRYILLRTERPNIYFGRFLGTLLYVTVSMLGVMLVICGYFHLVMKAYPGIEIWSWGFQLLLAVLLLILPYLAICSWVSGALSGGFTSLVACFAACIGPYFLAWYCKMYVGKFDLDISWIMYLLPLGWKDDLVGPNLLHRIIAMLVMLLFTAIFLALGYRHFSRRDL